MTKNKSRPRFNDAIREEVWNKTNGLCFHCEVPLASGSGGGQWDVDHFPVVYRDIEDQCKCWPFGQVVDPLDISNLQPSCTTCNRSHRFERKVWCFCGRSQLRIRKTWLWLLFGFAIAFATGVCVGAFLL